MRTYRNRKNIHTEYLLGSMYEIAKDHKDKSHPHSMNHLNTFFDSKSELINNIKDMEEKGFVKLINSEEWILTEKGYKKASESEVK